MIKEKEKKVNIKIKRSLQELDNAKVTISEFLKKNQISETNISHTELSFYEAVVNIIDHESSKYINEPVNIECSIFDAKIQVTISNIGEKFDLTKAKLPDIVSHYKSGKKRGLGIYFIRTLMDTVKYKHSNNLSTLTIVKNI